MDYVWKLGTAALQFCSHSNIDFMIVLSPPWKTLQIKASAKTKCKCKTYWYSLYANSDSCARQPNMLALCRFQSQVTPLHMPLTISYYQVLFFSFPFLGGSKPLFDKHTLRD